MADPAANAAARSYLLSVLGGQANLTPLIEAIRDVYGDSYRAGIFASAQQAGASVLSHPLGDNVPRTDAEWRAYWDAWKPGDADAAARLDHGGLAQLLANASITIRGMTETMLSQMGTALAEGAAKGLGSEEIARRLRAIVGDPDRARVIARTELARAVSVGTMDGYGASGVQMWEWVLSPGACPLCQDNRAEGPYQVGSGPTVPEHPNCVCSYAPITPDAGAAAGSPP